MDLTTVQGGGATGSVAASLPADIGTAASEANDEGMTNTYRAERHTSLQHSAATTVGATITVTSLLPPDVTTVQPSTTTAEAAIAASQAGQPSENVPAVSLAPVKAVASQVPAEGGVVQAVESSDPKVTPMGTRITQVHGNVCPRKSLGPAKLDRMTYRG